MQLLRLNIQSYVVTLETLTGSNPSVSLMSHSLSQEVSRGKKKAILKVWAVYPLFISFFIHFNLRKHPEGEVWFRGQNSIDRKNRHK